MPRYEVHSKTGKKIRCNGVDFTAEPQVVDSDALGWNEDQLAELRSSERHRALFVRDMSTLMGLRDDGPTMEEFIARGLPPADYPPAGFTEKRSPAAAHFRRLQREERARRTQPDWLKALAAAAPPEPKGKAKG